MKEANTSKKKKSFFYQKIRAAMGSERGNILIQVLIAGGIGLTMMAALSKLMINQHNAVNFLEDKLSMIDFERELEQLLGDPAACGTTLVGTAVSPTPQSVVITDASANVLYDPGDATKNRFKGLKINSIDVRDLTVGGPNTDGQVAMQIITERSRKGLGLDTAVTQLIFDVTSDASSNIGACSGMLGSGVVITPQYGCGANVNLGSSYQICAIGAYANDTDDAWGGCRVYPDAGDWKLLVSCSGGIGGANCRAVCF